MFDNLFLRNIASNDNLKTCYNMLQSVLLFNLLVIKRQVRDPNPSWAKTDFGISTIFTGVPLQIHIFPILL